MSVYSTQLRLRNKDVNLHRKLRTSVLFELMQEASIRHTEELGMGREMTLDRGLLWMVTLQRAEIARMPEYDECITLESWPGETMHLLFPRYYRVLDEKGETLLFASALSVTDFTVPFSYVDLNGHMNNTRYFDLAEDLTPAAREGRDLREIAVEYAAEARLSDTLRVTVQEDGDRFRVSGDTEKKIFRMEFVYQ